MNEEYNEYQSDTQAPVPGNYWKGALGMVLGSLVGGGIFIGLYILGYIAWIAPLAAGFLGSFLYSKFGGKNDKNKIIILWAVTLVVMAIAIITAILLGAYIEVNKVIEENGYDDVNFFEIFTFLMATNQEVRNAVLLDSILGAIFMVGVDVYMTFVIIKSQKNSRVNSSNIEGQ